MAKRTALYIRCSSLDQVKRGFSIPDQLARLRAEAKGGGELVVERAGVGVTEEHQGGGHGAIVARPAMREQR